MEKYVLISSNVTDSYNYKIIEYFFFYKVMNLRGKGTEMRKR